MIDLSKRVKNFIKNFLVKRGFRISKIGPYSIFDFESFLYRYLEVYKKFSFIQIGANDGVMNDPIYKFNMDNKSQVSGFVLEPLPDIYKKLVKNYESCSDIKPYNLAIHETESEMILYRVKPTYASKIPEFAGGIASFDKSHWQKTDLIPDEDYMEEVTVKCTSFTNFISENSINKIDLLLIDTEGYDYDILMSIDFSMIKPKIIRFEHGLRNKVMTKDNFNRVCNHLNSFGYQIITESYDATAYLLNPSDLTF